MPEGHTLHRLAVRHKRLFGRRPVRLSSPQGRFADGAALLDGRVLKRTDAYGKHLFHDYGDGHWLHVHLGLYGVFTDGPAPVPPVVGQVRLRLVGDTHWADLRGATACELFTGADRDALLARLGPDPLRRRPDPSAAGRRILRSRAPIGGLLMDQAVVSGVGNVYRAEVLFRAGINPYREGRSLTAEQWDALWADLVPLMKAGYKHGWIDTVRPEHDPRLIDGAAHCGRAVYVYRRTGLPCRVCGTPVRMELLAARKLYWCPTCQPA